MRPILRPFPDRRPDYLSPFRKKRSLFNLGSISLDGQSFQFVKFLSGANAIAGHYEIKYISGAIDVFTPNNRWLIREPFQDDRGIRTYYPGAPNLDENGNYTWNIGNEADYGSLAEVQADNAGKVITFTTTSEGVIGAAFWDGNYSDNDNYSPIILELWGPQN